jgi:hypothetical protein
MTSKKLGALLRSVPSATARAEAPLAAPAPEAVLEPTMPQRAAKPAMAEPEVPLQVLIPEHIRKQIAVKAAEEGRSLRALILSAIRSLGIEVTDEEIRGKRRRRNI